MNRSVYTYKAFEGKSNEWTNLIYDASGLSLLQAWAYGEAKAATGPWRIERGVFIKNDTIVGAAQTMVRTTLLPNIGLAWINRGPLVLADGVDQMAMRKVVMDRFIGQNGLYFRIAPLVDIPGPNGLSATSTLGWASAVIDLRQPERTLRKNLHGKWRNALVRAERAGLKVRSGSDGTTFAEFLEGHKGHLKKLGPDSGLDSTFLQILNDMSPSNSKLLCLTAHRGNTYLGGVAIARYGCTGEYLAGHNTNQGRANNASHLLLWMAMIELKACSFRRFDLGGMDEKLTSPGIYQFKKRMGGVPYRLANELEGGADHFINKLIRWRVERKRLAGNKF